MQTTTARRCHLNALALAAVVSALPALVVATAQTRSVPQSPNTVTAAAEVRLSKPETLLSLDGGASKGQPTRLAWSPDGASIYLRFSRFDRWANERGTHVLVDLTARTTTPVEGEPLWAGSYWLWKSGRSSPALPTWRFVFDARDELVRTTNVPREGNIGQHTADPAAGLDEVAVRAALSSQKVHVETLTLSGHRVDYNPNGNIAVGRTFGWAPAPRLLIVFVTQKGRLALMDSRGRVREIGDTSKALLPGWSEDGRRVAFIERVRNDKYLLRVVRVD